MVFFCICALFNPPTPRPPPQKSAMLILYMRVIDSCWTHLSTESLDLGWNKSLRLGSTEAQNGSNLSKGSGVEKKNVPAVILMA